MKTDTPANNMAANAAQDNHGSGQHCHSTAERPARYEIVPQRGGPRIRVRYREGSASEDCRLCR